MVSVASKTETFQNGNANDGSAVNSEMSALFNNDSTLATAVNNLIAGSTAITGQQTFNNGIKVDTISEKTSATGVTIDGVLMKDGGMTLADNGELTIDTGAITATGGNHTVDTESDDSSDDLDTINGGVDGKILTLRIEADARNVVVKHNTGNIFTATQSDVTLDIRQESITFKYDGELTAWVEQSRVVATCMREAATQADQETGTSTTTWVSPGRQHFHQSAAKVTGNFGYSTGTPVINESYNVASVDDDNTGQMGVNFVTAFSNTNYTAIGTGNNPAGSIDNTWVRKDAAGSVTLMIVGNGSFEDKAASLVCFGDFA